MEIVQQIASIISYVSLVIIAYGALIATVQFIRNELNRFNGRYSVERLNLVRMNFGYYLLIGLEFLIASDIIYTILDPDLQDLAVLGGIVVIRTVLTYFLNKEVQRKRMMDDKFNAGKT